MADIAKKTIIKALLGKGFKESSRKRGRGKASHHKWYIFHHGDKNYPQIRAKISHGTGYKTYGDSLLRAMKKRLYLDTLSQVHELLCCPMGHTDYISILREKEVI